MLDWFKITLGSVSFFLRWLNIGFLGKEKLDWAKPILMSLKLELVLSDHSLWLHQWIILKCSDVLVRLQVCWLRPVGKTHLSLYKSVNANQMLTSILKISYTHTHKHIDTHIRKLTHTHTDIYTHVVNCMGSKKTEELRHHCGKVSENQSTSAQGLTTNFSK